jgi:hypothetical protein
MITLQGSVRTVDFDVQDQLLTPVARVSFTRLSHVGAVMTVRAIAQRARLRTGGRGGTPVKALIGASNSSCLTSRRSIPYTSLPSSAAA